MVGEPVDAVPMNLRWPDEAALYNDELARSDLGGARVVPLAIDVAAMWAVVTRLKDNPKCAHRWEKLWMYATGTRYGCSCDELIERLRAEAPDEGTRGISPRYVLDTIAALARSRATQGAPVVTPRPVLDALAAGLDSLGDDAAARHYREMIEVAREVYHDWVKGEVQLALTDGLAGAERVCEAYLRNVRGYVTHDRVRDPATGERVEPDESLLRAVEEQINIPESRADDFRTEVVVWVGVATLDGKRFTPRSDERLFTACARKLAADADAAARLERVAAGVNDDATRADRATAVRHVVEQLGYDETSAGLLVDYVAQSLAATVDSGNRFWVRP